MAISRSRMLLGAAGAGRSCGGRCRRRAVLASGQATREPAGLERASPLEESRSACLILHLVPAEPALPLSWYEARETALSLRPWVRLGLHVREA